MESTACVRAAVIALCLDVGWSLVGEISAVSFIIPGVHHTNY